MMPRLSALNFALPGFLACIMVLGSATVIIAADNLKTQIFHRSLIIVGIASISWIFGVVQTTKNKEWRVLSVFIALVSACSVIIIGAITAYWISVLDPLNMK